MKTVFAFILILLSFTASASRLSRAFDALEIYNYFKAKNLFEKSLKRHGVPASYGLSVIYARDDNPFSNLDSALSKIHFAFDHYSDLKANKKEKYQEKYNVDSVSIVNQRDHITSLYFERARSTWSEFAFQDFIDKNPWSAKIDSAIYYRDKIAFEKAREDGGSEAYMAFLEKYPNSTFKKKAKDLFEEMLYAESTYQNNFIDYVNFVKKYPNSPFREKAEDKVYEIATETGTVEAYRNFIIEYPANHNIDKAWKYLYNAKMQGGYSSHVLQQFKQEYPDYPYQKELTTEINVADKVFYPFKSGDKWGYIDRFGNKLIENKFEIVEWFSEGLAVVKRYGKYGYLNKLGEMEIPAKYDDALQFQEGHAIVEVDEFYGMIDRNGDYIIEAEHEDLGTLSDGLVYFLKDTLYGYFDDKGIMRLKPQFTEAYDFENNRAVVSKKDYYGVIDPFGTTLIPFKYEGLYTFDDSSYIAIMNDSIGVIALGSDTILPFEFDYVGALVDGHSIVEKEETFNYIDAEGEFLLEEWLATYPEYRQLAFFNKGFAKIWTEDGFNLIDTTGKMLFRKDYTDIGSYSNLIAVKKDDKWGYLNPSGKKVIDFEYSYAFSFSKGKAIVMRDPFYGLIDEKGEYIIEPYQEEMVFINDSTLICKQLGKFGLLTAEGDTLLNYQYINIEPIDEFVVKVEQDADIFYYDLRRMKFIRTEEE